MKPLDAPPKSTAEDFSRAKNPTKPLKLAFWLLTFWAPLAVFVAHALMFWPWIVDDAAISFAYSRSLASGFGLVAQAGAPPVEGYSNLTWVLLMAPFYWLRIFDPVWTAKIVSLFFVALIFAACARLSQWQWENAAARSAATPPDRARGFAQLLLSPGLWLANWLLAINSVFVIWCSSGLENPLYALLLLALAGASLWWLRAPQLRPCAGLAPGILAALIAMTRPDGLSFALAFPLVVAIASWTAPALSGARARIAASLYYALGYALLFGAFVAFRVFYFGDWLPNTFRAKGGSIGRDLSDVAALWVKVNDLFLNVLGLPAILAFAGLIGALFWAKKRDVLSAPLLVSILFFALSVGNYLLMPFDWMGEYRFATPIALFGALALAQILAPANLEFNASRLRFAALRLGVVSLFLSISALNFWPRSRDFAAHPTVSYQLIKREFAVRFDNYADQLNLQNGSILLPDVGAMLLDSRLRVYDSAMLTDRRIALTLNKDQPAFYDYVFEEVRPTFIHTHGYWAWLAQLEADPRFRRDYVAIEEKIEPEGVAFGQPRLLRGDYVRRDVLRGQTLVPDANLPPLAQ